MRMWAQSHLCQKPRRVSSLLAAAFALFFLLLGASPVGERPTCLRQKIWPAVLRLS